MELYAEIAESRDYEIKISKGITALDLRYIAVLNRQNLSEHRYGDGDEKVALPKFEQILELRKLAELAKGRVAFSNIERYAGKPHFFVVKQLTEGRLLLAPLSPRYLKQIQQSIAFGEKGHAMIVDSLGRVVAHPNSEWQEKSMDASKVSVVKEMIARKTGVAQFYAPPLKADMIAGYTFVPETGWGVMVPQPVSELISHARNVQHAGLIIAALSLMISIFISWKLSNLFSHPVRSLSNVANRIANGDRVARATLKNSIAPSEIGKLEKSFNRMVEELQEKTDQLSIALKEAKAGSNAKSQFIAMVSHEIRTPISGAIGLLEILKETELDKNQNKYVDSCHSTIGNLINIVDDIIDYSQIESGKFSIFPINFDVHSLADDIYSLFSPMAKRKDLEFHINYETSIPKQIFGDPKRIRQVILNVVANAIKFTDSGKISINIRFENSNTGADSLVFSVIDTGIGIPADMDSDLFEEFSQVDNSHSRQYGGNGLGLTISKRLMTIMGGEIWYESQLDVGSNFHIRLPVNCQGDADD